MAARDDRSRGQARKREQLLAQSLRVAVELPNHPVSRPSEALRLAGGGPLIRDQVLVADMTSHEWSQDRAEELAADLASALRGEDDLRLLRSVAVGNMYRQRSLTQPLTVRQEQLRDLLNRVLEPVTFEAGAEFADRGAIAMVEHQPIRELLDRQNPRLRLYRGQGNLWLFPVGDDRLWTAEALRHGRAMPVSHKLMTPAKRRVVTKPGDVLYLTTEPRAAVVERQGGAWVQQPVRVLRPLSDEVIPEFLAAAIMRADADLPLEDIEVPIFDPGDDFRTFAAELDEYAARLLERHAAVADLRADLIKSVVLGDLAVRRQTKDT